MNIAVLILLETTAAAGFVGFAITDDTDTDTESDGTATYTHFAIIDDTDTDTEIDGTATPAPGPAPIARALAPLASEHFFMFHGFIQPRGVHDVDFIGNDWELFMEFMQRRGVHDVDFMRRRGVRDVRDLRPEDLTDAQLMVYIRQHGNAFVRGPVQPYWSTYCQQRLPTHAEAPAGNRPS
jgi:hypothetical protein